MLTIVIKAYYLNVVVDIKPIYLKKHYLFQNWLVLIVIKACCVNFVVDIKPIYLDKHLFQNKIFDLDKIYKLNLLLG